MNEQGTCFSFILLSSSTESVRVPLSIGICLAFHRNDAFSKNPEAEVRERYGKELSATELVVAEHVETYGSITSSKAMELSGLSERGSQQLLKRLAERGIIEKVGAGRNTRYVLSL